MSKKTIGFVLIGVGVVLAVVAAAADALRIGGSSGFGWMQIIGTAVGILLALGGIWLALIKK